MVFCIDSDITRLQKRARAQYFMLSVMRKADELSQIDIDNPDVTRPGTNGNRIGERRLEGFRAGRDAIIPVDIIFRLQVPILGNLCVHAGDFLVTRFRFQPAVNVVLQDAPQLQRRPTQFYGILERNDARRGRFSMGYGIKRIEGIIARTLCTTDEREHT